MAQTRENEEKVDYLHYVDKPLARYCEDVDLDKMSKDQERDDDPMTHRSNFEFFFYHTD